MNTEDRDELLERASKSFEQIDIEEGSHAALVQDLWQALVMVPDIEGIVGYIDQTLYANEDNSPEVVWRTDEVAQLLLDIRCMLTPEGDTP